MASYAMNAIGSRAISHHSGATDADEAEYDRLRALARDEATARGRCFERSREAYQRHDGAAAHQLSQEGKRHDAQMDAYNAQARDFIFRANNANRPANEIDLHGLFVEEAETILETRIKAATGRGEEGLHVIVGRGIHSAGHVRKLAPAVQRICQELGLRCQEEENEGRIYVWLSRQGGGHGQQVPPMPDAWGNQGGHHQHQQHHGGYQQQQHHGGQQQQHHHGGQQQHHGGQNQQNQNQNQGPDLVEEVAKKVLPKVLQKMGQCCVIM